MFINIRLIKETEEAIETLKTRVCCFCSKGKEITVGSFLSKKWKAGDLDALNNFTVVLDSGRSANFSARALAIMSELYSLISLLQLISGSYLKGAYNIRKAWKSYENLSYLNEFVQNNDTNKSTILDDDAYMVMS